eukprot:jgi/Phyca11/125941/e_gw1.60.285.1
MSQIQEKFAAIAVPVGAVSLDENTMRTNTRSSARTLMPLKPDKYGMRFYSVVCWETTRCGIIDPTIAHRSPRLTDT